MFCGRIQSSILLGRYFSTQRKSFFISRVRFQSDEIGQVAITTHELGKKFRGNNYIVGSRNEFDVFNFEIERKVFVSLTDNDCKVVRGIILLVTDNKFDDACFTDGREIRELIDRSSLEEFVQLLGVQLEADIFTGREMDFSGGETITLGSAKKYLDRDLPSLMTT